MEEITNRALLVQCQLSPWGELQFNLSVYSGDATLMFWHRDGVAADFESLGWKQESCIDGHTEFKSEDYPCIKVIICKK